MFSGPPAYSAQDALAAAACLGAACFACGAETAAATRKIISSGAATAHIGSKKLRFIIARSFLYRTKLLGLNPPWLAFAAVNGTYPHCSHQAIFAKAWGPQLRFSVPRAKREDTPSPGSGSHRRWTARHIPV